MHAVNKYLLIFAFLDLRTLLCVNSVLSSVVIYTSEVLFAGLKILVRLGGLFCIMDTSHNIGHFIIGSCNIKTPSI